MIENSPSNWRIKKCPFVFHLKSIANVEKLSIFGPPTKAFFSWCRNAMWANERDQYRLSILVEIVVRMCETQMSMRSNRNRFFMDDTQCDRIAQTMKFQWEIQRLNRFFALPFCPLSNGADFMRRSAVNSFCRNYCGWFFRCHERETCIDEIEMTKRHFVGRAQEKSNFATATNYSAVDSVIQINLNKNDVNKGPNRILSLAGLQSVSASFVCANCCCCRRTQSQNKTLDT